MENLENNYPNLYAELKVIGAEFVVEYRELILARSLSQSGALPDSMAPEVISDDHAMHVAIALADYWLWVEKGRGPGKQPPLEKIEGWVESTGIATNISVRSLAFLIARKIGREGTEGKHLVEDIVMKNAEVWAGRVRKAMTKDVNTRVKTIFSKLGET